MRRHVELTALAASGVLLLTGCPTELEPLPEPPGGLAPLFEPERVEVSDWTLAAMPSGTDTILDDLERGRFELPEDTGTDDDYGVVWFDVEPDENGGLGDYPNTIVYAVAEVPLPEGRRMFTKSERSLSVWVNDVPQTGDIYGSGRIRVPAVDAGEGNNDVVIRFIGGRGGLQAQLFSTPDELVFNTADLTFPDLVVGNAEARWLGVPILNLTDSAARSLTAAVIESEHFSATETVFDAVPPGSVTQVPFQLVPKAAWAEAEVPIPVTLRVSSGDVVYEYERTIEIMTVAEGAPYRHTFLSPVDGSIQYYGVNPPADFDPAREYALMLSLHGAGVDAIGQARSYSQKDDSYLIAPTNRRPFGFDWEEWGRLNGLAALDDATASFNIDPTRVYLTGHSMGGHGTWHVGVTTPGRFATVGPSAGWESFYSYGGSLHPTGALARARAHSDTLDYISNLARRGAYIIHGSADDNVPVTEGRNMRDAVSEVTDDWDYHEEPGAGHWWDGDVSPGADCVDWPPLFEFMGDRTLDPYETEFAFRSPGAHYSPTHSYVTLQSSETAWEDLEIESTVVDETLQLTTTNVRSLEIDGAALTERGYSTIEVDGEPLDVPDGPLWVGPSDGKTATVHGPFNQVFGRPHCYVYAEDEDQHYQHYAAYMASVWSAIGNGSACAIPVSALTDTLRAERNLIWLGVDKATIGGDLFGFEWDGDELVVGQFTYDHEAMLFVFPDGERLGAVMVTTAGEERYLFRVVPFSSRSGLPDYRVWESNSRRISGFFGSDWTFDL